MAGLTVVSLRSVSPPLRRFLTLFLVEVAPLTFAGNLDRRFCDKLWDVLATEFSEAEATLLRSSTTPQGFVLHTTAERTADFDGLPLGIRRSSELSFAEKVLAKSEREWKGVFQPSHRLILHLLDSAAFADAIWRLVLSEQQREILGDIHLFTVFAAGMHDIGKCSPHWQRGTLRQTEAFGVKLPEYADDGARFHDENGATFFRADSRIEGAAARHALGDICRGHHGHFKPTQDRDSNSASSLARREWAEHQREIEATILHVLGLVPESFVAHLGAEMSHADISAVTGIVMLADWLASDSEFISAGNRGATDYSAYYADARLRAEAKISSLGIKPPSWKGVYRWDDLYPDFTPNLLQESLIAGLPDGVEGLLLISAPPGAGKTKAALYAAARAGVTRAASGITFCLPTKATANAMFAEAKAVVPSIFEGATSIALRHSAAKVAKVTEQLRAQRSATAIAQRSAVYDESHDESSLYISEFLAERAPLGGMSHISVETIDQLITAATRRKNNPLRWLAVTGRIVILDEIHDFDAYTFAIIKRFVRWCGEYGIPVIAMSATLSGDAQRELAKEYAASKPGKARAAIARRMAAVAPDEGMPSPSWTHISRDDSGDVGHGEVEPDIHVPYATRLHPTRQYIPSVRALAQEHVGNGAAVLVVCHTVDQAVYTYDALSGLGDIEILHSRMPNVQKDAVVSRVAGVVGKGGERKPFILVSTQLIQQSFDFDFDVLVCPVAPIPDLIQRFGRVHRHNQGGRRAPAYEGAPRLELLVEDRIWEGKPAEANESNASLVPYNSATGSSGWQVLSAVEVLRRTEASSVPHPAGGFSWDAKGDLLESFRTYVSVRNEAEMGLLAPHLNAAWTGEKTVETELAAGGSHRLVGVPSDVDGRDSVTSLHTSQNHENATRDIQQTHTCVFASTRGGRKFFDAATTVPFNPRNDKAIAEYSISVGDGWRKRLEELGAVTPVQGLPRHILVVDLSRAADYARLDTVRGLIRVEAPNRRFMWY